MKIYTKEIDGKKIHVDGDMIVVQKDGISYFNPTEEMILEDGWVEYIEPEPTEEELLNKEKRLLINNIVNYDSSDNINEFYIDENKLWLDKSTRLSLKLRFDTELKYKKTTTSLWYNGMSFTLELEEAINLIDKIELYASMCYDITQQHITNVKRLNNIDDVKNYDYKTGYPEKVRI